MVSLPGGRWVIASSMEASDVKPGIFAIETGTAQLIRLYPAAVNTRSSISAAPTGRSSTCPGRLAAARFSGHGIAFREISDRRGELYVVNHGGRESIEVFDVDLSKDGRSVPRLRWRDCFLAPQGTVGNAVAWKRGRVYATVTPVRDGVPQPGDVRFWTREQGWTSLPGSEIAVPAGLAIAPDGSKIYVTSFPDQKVVELSLGGRPARREVKVAFGADNLRFADDGALLVGGLAGKPADIMRSCTASASPGCRFTGYVARIDPKSFALTCTLELGPTVSTTATQVGQWLWIGSSRAPYIWRAPVSALEPCAGHVDVGAGPADKK